MKDWVWFLMWFAGAMFVVVDAPMVALGFVLMWLAKAGSEAEKEMKQ